MPGFGLLWIRAALAGERSPSKVPVMDSFEPVSVAVTEPEPTTLPTIVASSGTGDSLVEKILAPCAFAPCGGYSTTTASNAAATWCFMDEPCLRPSFYAGSRH